MEGAARAYLDKCRAGVVYLRIVDTPVPKAVSSPPDVAAERADHVNRLADHLRGHVNQLSDVQLSKLESVAAAWLKDKPWATYMNAGAKGVLINEALVALRRLMRTEAERIRLAVLDKQIVVERPLLSNDFLRQKISQLNAELLALDATTAKGKMSLLIPRLKLEYSKFISAKLTNELVEVATFDTNLKCIEVHASDLLDKQYKHLSERDATCDVDSAATKLEHFKIKMMKHAIFGQIPAVMHELVNDHNGRVFSIYDSQTDGIVARATAKSDAELAVAKSAFRRKVTRRTAMAVGGLLGLRVLYVGARRVIESTKTHSLHHQMAMQSIKHGFAVSRESKDLHDSCVATLSANKALLREPGIHNIGIEVVSVFLTEIFKQQGSAQRPNLYVTEDGSLTSRGNLMLFSVIKSSGLDKVLTPKMLVNSCFGSFKLQIGESVNGAKPLVIDNVEWGPSQKSDPRGYKFTLKFVPIEALSDHALVLSSDKQILGLSSTVDLIELLYTRTPVRKLADINKLSKEYIGETAPLHLAVDAYLLFLSGKRAESIEAYDKLTSFPVLANYAMVSKLNLKASLNKLNTSEMLKAMGLVEVGKFDDMRLALFETVLAYTASSPVASVLLMEALRKAITDHPEWSADPITRKNILSAIFTIDARPGRVDKFWQPGFELQAKHLFAAANPDGEELYLRGLVDWARGENKLAQESMLLSADPRVAIVSPIITAGGLPSLAQGRVSVRRTTVQNPFQLPIEYRSYSPQ